MLNRRSLLASLGALIAAPVAALWPKPVSFSVVGPGGRDPLPLYMSKVDDASNWTYLTPESSIAVVTEDGTYLVGPDGTWVPWGCRSDWRLIDAGEEPV